MEIALTVALGIVVSVCSTIATKDNQANTESEWKKSQKDKPKKSLW